ncbi:MAG: hypothetical protein HY294_07030 [Candidatus Rokubacteria bacterium]|nr:hypothetical protein [Candidatus Rokubacteria bacterium]
MFALATASALAGCASYILADLPTEETGAQCIALVDSVVEKLTWLHQKRSFISDAEYLTSDIPKIYCGLEARGLFRKLYTDVWIYGVRERDRQDAILAVLQGVRTASHPRPIIVRFRDREVWIIEKYPTGGESRLHPIEEETLLRRKIID